MQKLSNVELGFIVKDMQCLVKSRLVKVYCTGEREYRFRFKKDGFEYSLQVEMPQGAYLSKYAKEGLENDFVKALRKRIANWIVDSIVQLNSDKVIVMELGRNKLYFDFIGKGNLILTDHDKIELIELKDEKRKLDKGLTYSLPELKKLDFTEFKKAETIYDLNLPKKMQELLAKDDNWKKTLSTFLEKPVITGSGEVVTASFDGEGTFNSLSEGLDSVNKPEVTQKRSPAYVRLVKRLEEQEQALKKALDKITKAKEYSEFLNSRKWLIQEKIKNKDYKENDDEIIIELD